MLPHCTTAKRIWRSRNLRRRPIRLSQCWVDFAIGVTYIVIASFAVPFISEGDYRYKNPKESAITSIRCKTLCLAAGIAALVVPGIAAAQTYPDRPIRIIVPFPPGSPPDSIARILGNKLTEQLGQPVIVDARPGGSGIIGVEIAKTAPPDGYTLLMAGISLFGSLPALKPK